MIVASLLLISQSKTPALADYAQKGIKYYSYVQHADARGFPDPAYYDNNATTETTKKLYLLSDSNDLVADEEGDKNRDEINVDILVREFGNQIGRTASSLEPFFPETLFTHAPQIHYGLPSKTRIESSPKYGSRIIKSDERELIFACFVQNNKSESRPFDHYIYSRNYVLKELVIQVFYTNPNKWVDPYTGQVFRKSVEEPKWPRAKASDLPDLFEKFGYPNRAD